jgi:nitrous oxide reductase accessory protein NosL
MMIMGNMMRLLLLFLVFGLIAFPAVAQIPAPPDAKSRCEVCGMFVAPYTNWVAVLRAADGRQLYFDGPKDLFICFNNLSKYLPGATPEDVELFVTEYYTVQLTPATELFFVSGSDVLGPMGQELVPVAGRSAAETFLRDHAGAKLLRFDGYKLLVVEQ